MNRVSITFGGEHNQQKRNNQIRQSIIDMRQLYWQMDEEEFVTRYYQKFGVPKETVQRVLRVKAVSG